MQAEMLESPLDRAAQFLLSHQSLDAFSPSTAMDMMFFERDKTGIEFQELSLDSTNVLNQYGEIRNGDQFPLPNGSFLGVTSTVLGWPAPMMNDPRVDCTTNNNNVNSPPSSDCGWRGVTNLQQSFVTKSYDLLPDFAGGRTLSTEQKLSQLPLARTVSCPATVIQHNISSPPGTRTPSLPVSGDSPKKRKGYSNGVPSPPACRKMELSRKAIKEEVEELDEKIRNKSGGGKSSDYCDKEKLKSVPDIPKPDYIHVRARRGQATDSHSLAERVRREKISERMRLLQDLVPGCNKITGKAGMLDQIINYVQSLQRQVEFLSMKLAAVNRRSEEDTEGFLNEEIFSPSAYHHLNPMPPSAGTAVQPPQFAPAPGSCSMGLPIHINNNHNANHTTNNNPRIHNHNINNNIPSGMTLRRTTSAPVAVTDDFIQSCFQDNSLPSVTSGWDFDLPNLYTMDFPQVRESPIIADQKFSGNEETHNLKMELMH